MEWIVKGTLALDGVNFYVHADTKEGALAKVAQGDFVSYDTYQASSTDWHLDPRTLEENE